MSSQNMRSSVGAKGQESKALPAMSKSNLEESEPEAKEAQGRPTSTAASEEAVSMLPTTDTSTVEEIPNGVCGAGEPESPVSRLQREAEERLRRLADAPVD